MVKDKMNDWEDPFKTTTDSKPIEDRLMERYIISQHKMQKRIEEEERRAKEMATPSINSKYKLHQAVTRQEDSSLDNVKSCFLS